MTTLVDAFRPQRLTVIGIPGTPSLARLEELGVPWSPTAPCRRNVALTGLQELVEEVHRGGGVPVHDAHVGTAPRPTAGDRVSRRAAPRAGVRDSSRRNASVTPPATAPAVVWHPAHRARRGIRRAGQGLRGARGRGVGHVRRGGAVDPVERQVAELLGEAGCRLLRQRHDGPAGDAPGPGASGVGRGGGDPGPLVPADARARRAEAGARPPTPSTSPWAGLSHRRRPPRDAPPASVPR